MTSISIQDYTFSTKEQLRLNARKHVESGAVTETYTLDRKKVIELLNAALASEWICVLRYLRHYYMAAGLMMDPIKGEFLEHAKQEQEHADMIAERITQLGGAPDLNPAVFADRSPTQYQEGADLQEMIKENLISERIVIDYYRELILYIGDQDTTTKRIIEHILAEEEDHADELANMLQGWTGK